MSYTQDCHYGFERSHLGKNYDEIQPSENKTIIECKNAACPEYYCKFKFFSGGQIPDEECEYFMRNMRDRVE